MSDFSFFPYLSMVAAYFACFGSLFITAWVRDVAEAKDFVDRPDGGRKSQKAPVALGGGSVIDADDDDMAKDVGDEIMVVVGWRMVKDSTIDAIINS